MFTENQILQLTPMIGSTAYFFNKLDTLHFVVGKYTDTVSRDYGQFKIMNHYRPFKYVIKEIPKDYYKEWETKVKDNSEEWFNHYKRIEKTEDSLRHTYHIEGIDYGYFFNYNDWLEQEIIYAPLDEIIDGEYRPYFRGSEPYPCFTENIPTELESTLSVLTTSDVAKIENKDMVKKFRL